MVFNKKNTYYSFLRCLFDLFFLNKLKKIFIFEINVFNKYIKNKNIVILLKKMPSFFNK